MEILLRRASMEDAERLLAWRNDPDTRSASFSTGEIALEEHVRWLAASLASAERQLYIAESGGRAVGTVRADFDATEACHELSWTVAPEFRGRGIGKRMVEILAGRLPGALRARVRKGQIASMRIAEQAGMVLEAEKDGVLCYRRIATRNA